MSLWVLARDGDTEGLRALLDRGADVNAAADAGWTALMSAAFNGHDACLTVLLDRGADVNLQSNNGMTVLIYAAFNGHDAIVVQLVTAGNRSWQHVPTPCVGLEMALRSVYTNAPQELSELFRRLEPQVQDVVRNTLKVLHRGSVNEEAVRMEVLVRVLDASNG